MRAASKTQEKKNRVSDFVSLSVSIGVIWAKIPERNRQFTVSCDLKEKKTNEANVRFCSLLTELMVPHSCACTNNIFLLFYTMQIKDHVRNIDGSAEIEKSLRELMRENRNE